MLSVRAMRRKEGEEEREIQTEHPEGCTWGALAIFATQLPAQR
jgi:hypothetical protein